MEEAISIRRGEARDVPDLAAFNRAMAKETEGIDLAADVVTAGVAGLLARPEQGFYLVVEAPGGAGGCLMVTYEWSDWRNGIFWWLQSVYVKPAWRRRGIYRALFAAVRAAAAGAGNVCGFRLYVEKENLAAQRTYEALGMEETSYKMFEALRDVKRGN